MKWLVVFIILLSASRLSPSGLARGSVIWNVGQGQWITIAEGATCFHFDIGGEFFPWERLRKLCGHRENKVLLSHWDWDHIGALAQAKILRTLPKLCILSGPQGTASSRKQKLLKRYLSCTEDMIEKKARILSWAPLYSRSSNESSQVYSYRNILMPGDSTKNQEDLWSRQAWVASARVLILGHHGSNTSTSEELMRRLGHLKMAISSARWRRYSHPHPETVARLKRLQVPLLRTEDWGHIWLE